MKRQRLEHTLDERLSGTVWYFHQHPMGLRLAAETARCITQYAAGKTLDLGAGMLVWRKSLIERGQNICYQSLDIEKRHEDLDFIADVCKGTELPDNEYDTIFCSQVIEHVPHPVKFLCEAFRICKPGGHLIISAPFLFYVHGRPHDYFRYTPDGLAAIAGDAGFETVERCGAGGLISFISMIPCTVLLQALGALPLFFLRPFFFLTPALSALDKLIDTSGRFPASSIVVARKPE